MSQQTKCQNCGYEGIKKFCPECGQKNIQLKKITQLLSDFFDTFLSLDFRIFSTLKYLIFKPGFLTKEYWDGRREKYLPPLRLYLIISFLTFVILPFITQFTLGKGFLCVTSEEQKESAPEGYALMEFYYFDDVINQYEEQYEKGEIDKDEFDSITQSITAVHKGMNIAFERRITIDNMLTQYVPMAMFLMMPLLAVLMHLILYRNKELFYIHHLIASVHLHSFMFLNLFILLLIMPIIPDFIGDAIGPLIIILPPIIYFIFSFKNTYNDNWLKSILKSLVSGPLYLIMVLGLTYLIFNFGMMFLGFYGA